MPVQLNEAETLATLRTTVRGENLTPATLADCEAFAARWHEAGREPWARKGYTAPGMDHDTYNRKTVRERRDWFTVDQGGSGCFMVRRADGQVFGIKAYGRPHLQKCLGHVLQVFK